MARNTRGRSQRRPEFDYAAQWADIPDDEELELPSGKVVLVKSPDLPKMAREGKIPNHLIGIVEDFVLGGMPKLMRELPGMEKPGAQPGVSMIKTSELDDYIKAVCVASIVEPKFVFEGESGGISIAKLSADDRFKVWDWSVGLTARIAAFRENRSGTVGDVESLPNGEAVRDDSEPTDGIEQSA